MDKLLKLYLFPNYCSLSPHVALREVGLPFCMEPVDLAKKTLQRSGADFRRVNPKGSVPALELEDGRVLTEGAAIVQYIADRRPDAALAPPAGTWARYRVQEWLNYVATELHKSYGALFDPRAPEAAKQSARDTLAARYDYLTQALEGRSYLVDDTYGIADCYLFAILRWPTVFTFMKVDLSAWPVLEAYLARIAVRPAVQAALDAEAALV
jgi:glutathione S-transferase